MAAGEAGGMEAGAVAEAEARGGGAEGGAKGGAEEAEGGGEESAEGGEGRRGGGANGVLVVVEIAPGEVSEGMFRGINNLCHGWPVVDAVQKQVATGLF